MNIVGKSLGAAVLFGLGATMAHASPVVVWCSNCNSTQINNAVLTAGVPAYSTVYVGDPITGSYGAYDWYADVDDSHNPPLHVKYVETTTGDPNVLKGVHAYIQFYQTAPVGWTKHESLVYNGSDPKASGYTVANFSDTQTNFNVWLNNNKSPAAQAAQYLGIGQQLVGATSITPQQIENVTFPDGSSINASQNTSCGCLNAYPDSARDAEGNPIPYADSAGKIHNQGGKRHFSDTPQGQKDYSNYLNQIKNMPIIVNLNGTQVGGGGSQGGGGGVQPVICTETDDGNGNKDLECYAG